MFTYLEEQTVTEAEQIRRTIQALFRQTCILQVKCDPATLTPRDNPQYEICARHRNFIADYLEVLGCELIHDAQEHIFRLAGEHMPRERLGLTGTVILLLVRLIYGDRIMGEGLDAPVTTLREIREYGKNTNLLTEKLTRSQWLEALYLLRMHQVIDVPGAVRDVEDETPVYIYSTVNLYVTAADISALIEEYQKEGEHETAEETLYTDPDQ